MQRVSNLGSVATGAKNRVSNSESHRFVIKNSDVFNRLSDLEMSDLESGNTSSSSISLIDENEGLVEQDCMADKPPLPTTSKEIKKDSNNLNKEKTDENKSITKNNNDDDNDDDKDNDDNYLQQLNKRRETQPLLAIEREIENEQVSEALNNGRGMEIFLARSSVFISNNDNNNDPSNEANRTEGFLALARSPEIGGYSLIWVPREKIASSHDLRVFLDVAVRTTRIFIPELQFINKLSAAIVNKNARSLLTSERINDLFSRSKEIYSDVRLPAPIVILETPECIIAPLNSIHNIQIDDILTVQKKSKSKPENDSTSNSDEIIECCLPRVRIYLTEQDHLPDMYIEKYTSKISTSTIIQGLRQKTNNTDHDKASETNEALIRLVNSISTKSVNSTDIFREVRKWLELVGFDTRRFKGNAANSYWNNISTQLQEEQLQQQLQQSSSSSSSNNNNNNRKVMEDAMWGILETFGKVTNIAKNSTTTVLESKLAKPFVPNVVLNAISNNRNNNTPLEPLDNNVEGNTNFIGKYEDDGNIPLSDYNDDSFANRPNQLDTNHSGDYEQLCLSFSKINKLFQPTSTVPPLSIEEWVSYVNDDGSLNKSYEYILERVYNGGIEHDIRQEVWKYIFHLIDVQDTYEIKKQKLSKYRKDYLNIIDQWETIIREHEFSKEVSESNNNLIELSNNGSDNNNSNNNASESSSGILEIVGGDSPIEPSTGAMYGAGDENLNMDVVARLVERKNRIEKDTVRTDRTIAFFANTGYFTEIGSIMTAKKEEELEESNSNLNHSINNASTESINNAIGSIETFFDENILSSPEDLTGVVESVPNLLVLRNILMSYTMTQFELGYVQGMNDLLSPILVIVQNESIAYQCFYKFMKIMSKNFDRNQEGIHEQLRLLKLIVKFMDPHLYANLLASNSINFFCCFRWILIWFKREFLFQDIIRLWEAIWCCPNTNHLHLFIAFTILNWKRQDFFKLKAFDEVLRFLNDLSGKIPINEILNKSKDLFEIFKWRLQNIVADRFNVNLSNNNTEDINIQSSINEFNENNNYNNNNYYYLTPKDPITCSFECNDEEILELISLLEKSQRFI